MAPQVLLKNGNVRERQRVRIDETHFLQKKQNKTILELLREQGEYLECALQQGKVSVENVVL